MTEIIELPPAGSLDGDELVPARDSAGDVKATIDQIGDYLLQRFTPQELLTKLIAADPGSNGLDAETLEGYSALFFQNANNLSQGKIPEGRLPTGTSGISWSPGGEFNSEGSFKGYIRIPSFILGTSQKLMIQYGWSTFEEGDSDWTINFPAPFASGFGTSNKPLVLMSPECRRDNWNNQFSAGNANVELDVRLWYTSLTSMKGSSIRNRGSGPDNVRANWIALGGY